MELSAIIIAYNGERFLPDCVSSLEQDLAGIDHEIIVVDNGSTDNGIRLIEGTPNITIIRNGSNLGFARAVNTGIDRSRGKFLYFLNQDLRFRSGSTRALLDRLKAEEVLGMIGPKFVSFDGTTQPSARSLPRFRHVIYDALLLSRLFPKHREFSSWRMGWFDHESEMYVEQPLGSAMMIPRSVVEKIGVLDERFPIYFNDVDFCRRMRAAGLRALYFPAAVVEHFLGGSTQLRAAAMRIESHQSMYRYLAKYSHWYELPVLWICGALLLLGLIPSLMVVWLRRQST